VRKDVRNSLKLLVFLAVAAGAEPALAWEPHTFERQAGEMIVHTYRSRTTVREIIHASGAEANRLDPQPGPGLSRVSVIFDDDPTGLCVQQAAYPGIAQGTDEPPLTNAVAIEASDSAYLNQILARLMVAKATGAEVTVVIDARNCRLVALRD
jgi:hypothetical protein